MHPPLGYMRLVPADQGEAIAMALVTGKWPKTGVTFETIRGNFLIPPEMLERASLTGDTWEVSRLFAQKLPDEAKVHKKEKTREGGLRVFWRIVRVVDGN